MYTILYDNIKDVVRCCLVSKGKIKIMLVKSYLLECLLYSCIQFKSVCSFTKDVFNLSLAQPNILSS